MSRALFQMTAAATWKPLVRRVPWLSSARPGHGGLQSGDRQGRRDSPSLCADVLQVCRSGASSNTVALADLGFFRGGRVTLGTQASEH